MCPVCHVPRLARPMKGAGSVTQPYIHVRGATTSICRRTSFRKAFLAPWHPLVNEIWLYALADAARVTGVSIHMSKLVVTHHHTDVTPSHPNLPEFTRRLHSDVSGALNELLREHGYEPPRQIWDGRPPHYLRLLDASAQMSQLTCDYLNQPAAGLVERPEHMPGRQLEYGMWATEGLVVKKPPVFFGGDRARELQCNPEASPEVMRAFGGDLDGAIHHMRKLAREGLKGVRAARTFPAMGAQKLRRLHPYDEPRSMAEPSGQRVPTFRVGAGGEAGRQQRIAAATETKSFRREHAQVRQQRLEGDTRPFPFGTYGQRVYHGAPVADRPDDDALLAQPGALLDEVLDDLVENPASPADRVAALNEVRADIVASATATVEANELDYRSEGCAQSSTSADRPPPETRHRSDPRPRAGTNPRRLIIRRDTRRGRPRKHRSGDPPSE